MTRQLTTITIATAAGPREVEAYAIGDWAAHSTSLHSPDLVFTFDPYNWTVTHRPTGLSVVRSLDSEETACRIVDRLAAEVPAPGEQDARARYDDIKRIIAEERK